ncbi:MAG: tRNA guanosine(34) transglycosylase Tgt [Chthoniobacteraceae bacterium]|nr:tRNA guanosine(34) transglycosylase Tgt [Chthoniobacteraceae bacterium]
MTAPRLPFCLEAVAPGSRARAATLQTLHNTVRTPVFMPVGTQATVKAQLPQTLEDAGSQILLANTYHLLLRPGPEVFRRMGGIHGLTSWKRSVLTDSGGFQIFSLPNARSMGEEGASFQSYLDGRTILLSPEVSIATQRAIGSDIMMALDQCIPSTAGEAEARQALELTQRWALRSLAARGDSPQALFGIVQGALFPELRRASAEGLRALAFDGFAIGGLAVGEGRSEREDTCAFTTELLPRDKPRYLMGVGTPLDILEAVHRGVDMFDCIIPTQVAQRGGAFTSRGFLQLRRGVYQCSPEPLDAACPCPTCARFSRAYLHHLTKTGETLGWQLLGQHNLYFYHRLMAEIRASILAGSFLELYREKREILHASDADNPVTPPRRTRRKRVYRMGAYEVHTAPEGFGSIRHIASGEIMHSRTPPIEEARRLYVEQPGLAERLRLREGETPETAAPLGIWDVGLGAAANAMAAIQCYEAAAGEGTPLRPLRIVSFENDLDSLRLARVNNAVFPYLRHAAPDALLKTGAWHSPLAGGIEWTLVKGDFPATLPQAQTPPEVIFYDLFSSKSDGLHWTPGAFRELSAACAGRAVELLTYTCSTAIRASLLASGFWLARGVRTGEKTETTVALTPEAVVAGRGCRYQLLAADWLAKWERSGAQFPTELAPEEREAFATAVRGHAQF